MKNNNLYVKYYKLKKIIDFINYIVSQFIMRRYTFYYTTDSAKEKKRY